MRQFCNLNTIVTSEKNRLGTVTFVFVVNNHATLIYRTQMPLPDEKPRQSVANLIGRFEHQQKKQRSSSPGPGGLGVVSHSTGDSTKDANGGKREWPPRSLSATSHITGDAAKEAMKREWPPRAPVSTGNFTSEWPPKQPAGETEPSVSPGSKTPPEKSPLSRTSSQSAPLVEDPPKEETVELPAAEIPVPQSQPTEEEKPAPVAEPAPIPKPTNAAPATTKSLSKSVKSPPKPSTKLPPSSFSKSLHPPKPDSHDRKSSTTPTASTSGRQSRPSSRATVRSKTPSNAPPPPVPKTPSSKTRTPAAPRTPAAAPPRPKPAETPKTPRTGLYAPTAASLAKARDAQPPQPERKKTLSSSVSLDRLSKPTAASLSKARSPAAVNTPPPPQRKAATPAKPRASAPARMKPAASKGKVAASASVAGAAVGSAALSDAHGVDEVEHSNGHAVSTDGEQDHDSELLSDSAHPEIVLSDVEGQEHGEEEIPSHEEEVRHRDVFADASPEASEHEPGTAQDEQISVVEPTDSVDPASNLHHAGDQEEQVSESSEVVPETDVATPAEDIEDIVNLLETTSFTSKAVLADSVQTLPAHEVEKDLKPETVVLLEQAADIPDEE